MLCMVTLQRNSDTTMVQSSFSKVGVVVGEVVEIDEAIEKREKLEFARFRVKTMVSTTINMEKDFCINGCSCKVIFEEEMSFRRCVLANGMAVARSLCDSVGSEFGAAGEGGVGAVGRGRIGNEETVRSKLDPDFLGKERHCTREVLKNN
ncbi:hypothetical protein ACSQ67_016515 [Phaseolus vulgaris]